MTEQSLHDRIVLVTGAARGIGEAISDAVVAKGGTAIRTDLAEAKNIDHALDVTSEADWIAAIAWVEARHGRLDGLVNNAGIAILGTVEATSFADWRRVQSVNLDGTFLGCKHGFRLLRRSKAGSIVNMSSISGLVGGHNLAAYNASKGGVRLLTKSVALYGARLAPPIRCNSIHPAFTETDMVQSIVGQTREPARAHEKMVAMMPMQRLATRAEIALGAVHLLSDASSFMTGSELVIDGGLSAQ
ncbi:MAG: SDR family oxidoreductase [Alphaproteobacteria bacterium]|nr:SDR family oxidoreductase [Alphaproteobacteria bacterium]